MGICGRCKINKRGFQYCYRSGYHYATMRKPGPRVGSKRPAAGEPGRVGHKRQRTQGCALDREAGRDSTHPTASAPVSSARPRYNSAPQLRGTSSASIYLAALGPRQEGGGGCVDAHHRAPHTRGSEARQGTGRASDRRGPKRTLIHL